MKALGLLFASVLLAGLAPTQAANCRIKGFAAEVQCGSIKRALDPKATAGKSIDLHYIVLPALALNKLPDPLFFLAGGPGQSAISLAAQLQPLFSRLNNRRDIVFVDQRGTGKTASLACATDPRERFKPLSELLGPQAMEQSLSACFDKLAALPHADWGAYNTSTAMQDLDAVRAALGYESINLIGGSYGTRAVLEYQRQFPKRVRRAVIDGVAPPDMVLPLSFGADAQAALKLMLAACGKDKTCAARYPDLSAQFDKMLTSLPAKARLPHPTTGRSEEILVTREMVAQWLRLPLYAPQYTQALPFAIAEATRGDFTPLAGLGNSLLGGDAGALAWGMHFAVVCAEDYPRMAGSKESDSAVFGSSLQKVYDMACSKLKVPPVEAAFYVVPTAATATLVLSGGADPVTPPRHGERVTKALGAKARHLVVPEAGHGVISIGCMRDVLFRFYNAANDAEALAVDASCMGKIPRPAAFIPFGAQGAAQ